MNNKSFTFVDVETPNRSNDKICSIGIINILNEKKVFEKYYLVNPETYFDKFNIDIHKIKPQDVKNKPTFKEIWEELEEYFVSSIVIAHNANFDLNVIHKTLKFYEIQTPNFNYFCTYLKAKRHLNEEKYNLKYLCDKYNICLNKHHDAMEDTVACYELFEILCSEFELLDKDICEFKQPKIVQPTSKIYKKSINIDLNKSGLNFANKTFCLSGEFKNGTKSEVENFICEKGGNCVSSVIRSVDYLVVGGEGSCNWAFGNYGTKVKKALEMKEKGFGIEIISEESLFGK